ncbi:uncharacterized protein EKO05_0005933 [Ascochyta rabiei]|uniref:N-acetyltransferase n=1 Tax=Didymella rabiei TaxID=5454 RepID=A0A163JK58_DIDRA|nr:uncharacterized protein EKO05_0005933 [Ascochyta rabiei]KZM26413.1 N-acetyltransferase [Ascochyta rabiei]UPX15487.1 hypothetical protein EKO05_0005933 [Ascochyta rabiei]
MAAKFEVSEAEPQDADAIALLFALSWASPFTHLQFGQVDPAQLATSMVPRIAEQMAKENSRFVVARHQKTHGVAAVAQWTLPAEEGSESVNSETQEDSEERQQFEDEVYKRSLPDSSNRDLVMDFTLGLRRLREETLQGRKHFLLENLATHPDYRGMGLASRLIQREVNFANERQMLMYLDTASDNPAASLYKKLGFEEQGRNTIEDLSKYASLDYIRQLGCDTRHTHVAFLRYPDALSDT